MKLKQIHMQGFKSFADRTIINYHNGITGVIGPNGAGKSNITDAVRWVMGEQTAKNLRADDPTDIIFSGSQNRKPISMAEVMLTFTNDGLHCPAEFLHLPEISIGRRIYRNGEREYLLNKEPCRLKDIVDFLLSIGLGAKSNAIIQQDKRDRIIQASPDDLRDILEETAGITIFKVKRKEAEKRLESTAERLKNLAEIESELSRQKESLQDQVEKAQEKFKLTQELKNKEVELICNHVGFYRSISTKLKGEIDKRNVEIQSSQLESTEWETRANDLKSTQLELIQQIKSNENSRDDAKISLTKYQERIDNFKQRHEERIKQKSTLQKEVSDEKLALEQEVARKESILADLEQSETQLRKSNNEMETLNFKLEEAEESLQVEKIRSEEIRSEMRAVETTLNSLRIRNESSLDNISKYNANLKKFEDREYELTSSKNQLSADRFSLVSQLKQISQGMDEVVLNRVDFETQIEKLNLEHENIKQQRDIAKEKQLEINSTAASLQKIIDSNIGLTDGTLALKENLSSYISGFLFENVSLQRDDEQVLEHALPQLFQSALVNDVDAFIEVLDKIEEDSISRVNLLVKEFILPLSPKEEQIKNSLLTIHGIHCTGNRLEGVLWEPARHIFNRIFICQDEWIAIKARKICTEALHFIFVTQRGAVIQGIQEMSFGANTGGVSQGVLRQKRDYEESLVLKEQQQEILASFEGKLFLTSEEKKKIEVELSDIITSVEKEKTETQKYSSQIENFDLQIKHVEQNLNQLLNEKNELIKEMEITKESFAKNQQQIEKLENEHQSFKRDLDEYEEDLYEKKSLRDEINSRLMSLKSTRAVASERQQNSRRHYEEITLQIQRMQQKLDSHIVQLEDLNHQITNTQTDFESIYAEIESLQKQVANYESKLEYLLSQEDETAEELRVMEQKLKSEKDLATTKQKFINDKQLELARCDTILETALKDALEKFNLAPEMLPFEASEDVIHKNTLEGRIKQINTELTGLGAVNERALEEYQSVEERLTFLLKQKEDIERSVSELNISIQEIEETTKLRFKDIFDKVNVEFQKIFPVLFPTGYGELHLINEQELLTSGVEILVRLPGKKMQNMSLFSGGEKALIAISLIFSLLKTTPAPFCFLDEVDAPLDEANVGRFNDVLDALSNEFQFVVITHNRRTMEVLDTIYGISMHEPGVSKLVSVDLSEVPEHLRKKHKAAVKPLNDFN